MNGVSEIRSAFLGFFKKNGHEIVATSPLSGKDLILRRRETF